MIEKTPKMGKMGGAVTTCRRAIFMLFDGARWDVFQQLVDAGELPRIRTHLVPSGRVSRAVACFPTVSGPAHLPFMTGCFPGTLGAPGIYWFDRRVQARDGWALASVRSYLTLAKVSNFDRDLAPGSPNLAAAWPDALYVFGWYTRGSPDAALLTRWTKVTSFLRGFLTKDWLRCDDDAEAAQDRAIEAGGSFVFSVFPSPDELGHRFGPTSDEAKAAYRKMDGIVGRLFDRLARRGEADSTLVVLSSDHGQSPTHTHFPLDRAVGTAFGTTLAYKRWPTPLRGFKAVVLPSGNGMANVYFRGEGWDLGRPDPALFGDFACRLLDNEAIDHVAWREPGGWLRVTGRLGAARMREVHGGIDYRVEGTDPFGYGPLPRKMDPEAALCRTEDTPYPDAPFGLLTWARSPRAGDLLVTSHLGHDLRDWFEYQEPHGTHGGLHAQHAHVPVLCNRPLREGPMRTVDMYPTMIELTGRKLPMGVEGVSRALSASGTIPAGRGAARSATGPLPGSRGP